MFYDVIEGKYEPINAQNSESDFGKPPNWETSLYFDKVKFSGAICK